MWRGKEWKERGILVSVCACVHAPESLPLSSLQYQDSKEKKQAKHRFHFNAMWVFQNSTHFIWFPYKNVSFSTTHISTFILWWYELATVHTHSPACVRIITRYIQFHSVCAWIMEEEEEHVLKLQIGQDVMWSCRLPCPSWTWFLNVYHHFMRPYYGHTRTQKSIIY